MILRDFQILLGPLPLPSDAKRLANFRLFPVYEAARLWLKEHRTEAPFCKVAVQLEREYAAVVSLNVCHAHAAVDVHSITSDVESVSWIVERVLHGLRTIHTDVGWRNKALEDFIGTLPTSHPTCHHRFARLRRQTRDGKTTCDLWLDAEGIQSKLVARFTTPAGVTAITVKATDEPLFLEDEFPVASAILEDNRYVLRDKDRRVLFSTPLPRL